jgi:hypothetical protein
MLENVSVLLVTNFVEVIHIELAHKRRKIAVAKVGRQDLLFEALNVQNSEMGAVFTPGNNPRVLSALNHKELTSKI